MRIYVYGNPRLKQVKIVVTRKISSWESVVVLTGRFTTVTLFLTRQNHTRYSTIMALYQTNPKLVNAMNDLAIEQFLISWSKRLFKM